AKDGSGIDAIAGAASIAVGFGMTSGVAVAVGLSLAFNEVGNDVQAYVRDADQGVTSRAGDIVISAISPERVLFDADATGLLSAENLNDAATVDADNPNDPTILDNNVE